MQEPLCNNPGYGEVAAIFQPTGITLNRGPEGRYNIRTAKHSRIAQAKAFNVVYKRVKVDLSTEFFEVNGMYAIEDTGCILLTSPHVIFVSYRARLTIQVAFETLILDCDWRPMSTAWSWRWKRSFGSCAVSTVIRTAHRGPARTSNGLQGARSADTTFQNYGTVTTRTRVSERSPRYRSRWVCRLKSGLVALAKPSLDISLDRGHRVARTPELRFISSGNTNQTNGIIVSNSGLRRCHRRQRLSTELHKPSEIIYAYTLTLSHHV